MYLSEILYLSKKIETVNDILSHLDAILELAKDDVFNISKSKYIFFNDFEFTFSEATKILKMQLKKKHLLGIKKLYKLKNTEKVLAWIIARLINIMRNITTNKSYKLYIDIDFISCIDDCVLYDEKDALSIILEEEENKEIEKLKTFTTGEIGGKLTESGRTQMVFIF